MFGKGSRWLALGLTLVIGAGPAMARDWFIDAEKGSDSTGDGTAEKPFETILRATTNSAFAKNDFVYLEPGDYTNGVYNSSGKSRCYIGKAGVTLTSTQGAAKTRIHGLKVDDANGYAGAGDGAVRCLYLAADNIVVSNLTLVGGASCWTNSNSSIDVTANSGGAAAAVTTDLIVDCVISNCTGRGGSVRNALCINDRFVDCKGASILRTAKAYYCLFENCDATYPASGKTSTGAICSFSSGVNCTFAFCRGCVFNGKPSDSYRVNNLTCFSLTSDNLYQGTYTVSSNNVTRNLTKSTVDNNPFFAAFDGDFRLVDNVPGQEAGALDKGDVGILETAEESLGIPAAYRRSGDARVHIGALGAVVPACGALHIDEASAWPNGQMPLYGTYSDYYLAYSETYPVFFRLSPLSGSIASGKGVYNYWINSATYGSRFPESDGSLVFCPPADVDRVEKVVCQKGPVLYVDCEHAQASDSNDGTEDHPFKTIQAAVDAVSESLTVILVKPGIYDEGGADVSTDAGTVHARVVMRGGDYGYVIRSTAGASQTFIVGAPDPDTASASVLPGCGPKAVRCVWYDTTGFRGIQGFTLTGGYTDRPDAASPLCSGAAVYGRQTPESQLTDCVISNCWGGDIVSGVSGCCLLRSRVLENHSSAALLDVVSASGVLIADNEVSAGPLFKSCGTLDMCSVAGNTLAAGQTLSASSSAVYRRCLFDLNGFAFGTSGGGDGNYAGNGLSGATLPDGFTASEALFVDAANGDFRLGGDSPALRRGSAYATNLASAALDGDTPRLSPDGQTVLPGAVQKDGVLGVRVLATNGGLSVSGGGFGFTKVTDFTSITVSRDLTTATRPCIGFTVNGVTNLFAEATSVTVTSAEVLAAGAATAIAAIYTCDWYVNADPTAGSDSNDGFTAESPYLTIAAALGDARIQSGDTVHLAAGSYASGEMAMPASVSTKTTARAAVPASVVLEGAGADETFIVGGTNVRCVYLEASAKVSKVTLTGAKLPKSKGSGDETLDVASAGVLAVGTSAVAEDCVVSNNVAYCYTAGYKVSFVRCRIADNVAGDNSPAGNMCVYSQCLIDRNRGQHTTRYCYFYNCTLGADNTDDLAGKSPATLHYLILPSHAKSYGSVNTLFLGAVVTNATYQNCICATNASFPSYAHSYATSNQGVPFGKNNTFVDLADVELDADGCPLLKTAVTVDCGDLETVLSKVGSKDDFSVDLAGKPRISNAELDVGCREYDWRGAYARDLAARRDFTVTKAGPQVVETDDQKVRVKAEHGLTALWTSQSAAIRDYGLTVQVTGAGSLTVRLNGEELEGSPVTEAEGAKVLSFRNNLSANTLEFEFAGEGSADLSEFTRGGAGLMLMVR